MKKVKATITYVVENYDKEDVFRDLNVEELITEGSICTDRYEKEVKSHFDELCVFENGLDNSNIKIEYEISEVEDENNNNN